MSVVNVCPPGLALESREEALVHIRRFLHTWRPDLWSVEGQRVNAKDYRTAKVLAEQLGVDRRILIRQAKRGHLRSWMGEAWSGYRMYPALFIHVGDAEGYNALDFSGKIQFTKARDCGCPLGYLSTTKLAKQLGVSTQRLGTQARSGCYPSEIGREYDVKRRQYRKTLFVHVEDAVAYNQMTRTEKRAAGMERKNYGIKT